MKLGYIFKTPTKRIMAIIATAGLSYSFCVYFFSILTTYSYLSQSRLELNSVDSEYLREFSKEYVPSSMSCSPWECKTLRSWPFTRNYAREYEKTKMELDILKQDGASTEIDSHFIQYRSSFYWPRKTITSPFESFESMLKGCKSQPNYYALRDLQRQIRCYKNHDCSEEDMKFFGRYPRIREVISLKDTVFYGPTFRKYLNVQLDLSEDKFHQNSAFLVSAILLAFAFGFLDTFVNITRRILEWIRNGD